MKLKGSDLEKNTEQQKIDQSQRQARILQDKERARQWAEKRRLRQVPVAVAREVISVHVLHEGSNQQTAQILLDLENRKSELLIELTKLETAI